MLALLLRHCGAGRILGSRLQEDDPRSSLPEEADGCGSDAAGASGDEGYFVVEGERDAWVELRSVLRHILDAIESFFRTQASPVS